ncbi:hypothetical protein SAMN05518801_11832 [Novosphingobium sp. CF614]|uniref:hypothetical protein n=1 Tax=Novosphingobium sp. CF614 TaxID=1884364 RepID=UPI0008E14C12|nr:hypothetical protein [Novosphingobium sp. CF614]SFG34704.1 hypothetical protein SAMN05518801_11832 [Novosphingobium sp. CF614]
MTIRFAAAWGGTTPAIVRALCPSAPLGAVNDNRRAVRLAVCTADRDRAMPLIASSADEQLLVETLRHFARFGLAAAAKARAEAEAAESAGNSAGRDRWIAICRQLDRQMADACTRELIP